jgi:hypothetical protein
VQKENVKIRKKSNQKSCAKYKKIKISQQGLNLGLNQPRGYK